MPDKRTTLRRGNVWRKLAALKSERPRLSLNEKTTIAIAAFSGVVALISLAVSGVSLFATFYQETAEVWVAFDGFAMGDQGTVIRFLVVNSGSRPVVLTNAYMIARYHDIFGVQTFSNSNVPTLGKVNFEDNLTSFEVTKLPIILDPGKIQAVTLGSDLNVQFIESPGIEPAKLDGCNKAYDARVGFVLKASTFTHSPHSTLLIKGEPVKVTVCSEGHGGSQSYEGDERGAFYQMAPMKVYGSGCFGSAFGAHQNSLVEC